MKYDIEEVIPENYQRAFFFKGLGLLLMDYVLFHYRKRNFLTIYNNETLGTYIENSAADKTLQDGKDIFSSERNFAIFESGFRNIIKESEEYISYVEKLETASIGDFFDLKAMVEKMYYYFEKTEFFFTDACYYGEISETLKKNLFVLGEDLKMKSRPLLIQLLTSTLYHVSGLVAQQHNVNADDVKFYHFDEVIHLIETGIPTDPKIIADRKKSYVMYCEDGAIIDVEGENKALLLERFKEPDYTTMTEFKGTIANKGKVIAKARVILPDLNIPYAEFVKKLHNLEMNEGEILITETTSPDFVPLMKKAGGIIANQGGLNSHAAIMSRELGVPCLVATYHATDIIKTGDLIELNANLGIVKVIK